MWLNLPRSDKPDRSGVAMELISPQSPTSCWGKLITWRSINSTKFPLSNAHFLSLYILHHGFFSSYCYHSMAHQGMFRGLTHCDIVSGREWLVMLGTRSWVQPHNCLWLYPPGCCSRSRACCSARVRNRTHDRSATASEIIQKSNKC